MSEALTQNPAPPNRRLAWFFAILAVLALLQVVIGQVSIPEGVLLIANILVSVIFVATPILAIYVAAGYNWSWKLALAFLVGGAAAHYGSYHMGATGVADVLAGLVKQTGLICWCLGLGALLSTLIRDKNLIVPIAIFLALLDMFLVLTPIGLTQKMLTEHKKESQKVLYDVPAPKTQPAKPGQPIKRPEPLAFVGPADFLFLGMFFVAIYRFQLRSRETIRWVIPVLAGYLLIVLLFGGMRIAGVSLGQLPALLPIGATIFIVNRKEFKMTRDEVLSTLLIAALGVGLLIYGMTRPRPRAAPLPPPDAQAPAKSAPMQGQASTGPPR